MKTICIFSYIRLILIAAGVDKTALGWILSGGATHWTAGGLQAGGDRSTVQRADVK